MWDLIVSVPEHRLSFYFDLKIKVVNSDLYFSVQGFCLIS